VHASVSIASMSFSRAFFNTAGLRQLLFTRPMDVDDEEAETEGLGCTIVTRILWRYIQWNSLLKNCSITSSAGFLAFPVRQRKPSELN
jgi:hypothetical protein